MKSTRHSEEQIIAILKQCEAGLATAELCRQQGITEQRLLPLESQVWVDGEHGCEETETTGGRESKAKARGGGADAG